MKEHNGIKLLVFLGLVLSLTLAGCAATKPKESIEVSGGLPQVTGFADDITDISMPAELKWDRRGSLGIKTESFRGGIWRYRGRVEILSLKDFMISSMQGNNWRLAGETTSKDIMLAFVKPNKTCMIFITDGFLGRTELTLYITMDQTAAMGMNPFGEIVHP
ncbi:hypothetical protein [Desulfobulbus alkaliphilus]|uniref:hypothetical protein n=1 Tax=Desulfobulbus alkaliphilus TaxID=869814 RepID=UPI001965FB8E|nr:hypothetical protein [Desulfobulbus alkaliphilus]MBM9535737.1 hypothetical protein [Desulfobulbus alkaliphilus]